MEIKIVDPRLGVLIWELPEEAHFNPRLTGPGQAAELQMMTQLVEQYLHVLMGSLEEPDGEAYVLLGSFLRGFATVRALQNQDKAQNVN